MTFAPTSRQRIDRFAGPCPVPARGPAVRLAAEDPDGRQALAGWQSRRACASFAEARRLHRLGLRTDAIVVRRRGERLAGVAARHRTAAGRPSCPTHRFAQGISSR